INGRAPNSSVTGFHLVEVRNSHTPIFVRSGAEPTTNSYTRRPAIANRLTATTRTTQRATKSPVGVGVRIAFTAVVVAAMRYMTASDPSYWIIAICFSSFAVTALGRGA